MPTIILSLLKAIGIRGAIAIVLGLALLVTGARLNHAKADQLDKRSCVAGKPCTGIKWKDEAIADERDIATLAAQINADALSIATLRQSVADQNAAVDAAKAAGDAREARAGQMVAEARQTARTAQARATAALAAKVGADVCESANAVILESVR